ncbi:MAG: hypothetical protein JWN26_193 [Candidatus Saccharibacteria bacterium]|nr:hypothetical protein [Candidatus Saccharibacteria bacterium]
MQWIRVHASFLTLILGSSIITAWTFLRFFTKPIIYDLLGQQVLASQWLHGFIGGSVTAPTNYILKIFFVYMPLSALHVDPKIALIVTTIIINIVTYVCLFFLIRQILTVLHVKISSFFYLAMLWVATAAGSLFWIQFSNSRNIEVVGGVWLLLLGLRFMKEYSTKLLVGISILATVLFFADPLQIYMTAASLLIYAIVMILQKRFRLINGAQLLSSLIVAFCVATLLTLVINHLLSITFANISTFNQYILTLSHPLQAAKETLLANVHFVSATYDTGRVSQLINLMIIGLAIISTLYVAFRKKLSTHAIIFIAVLVVVIELVYFASGQALQGGDTSRYLVMLIVPLVILLSFSTYLTGQIRNLAKGFIAIGLFVNICLLGHALTILPTHQLPGESHVVSIINYLNAHSFTYGYASIDTSIPASYLYPDSKQLLPLGCSGSTLVKDSLFYDRAAYAHIEAMPSQNVVIFLDANSITNAPNVCSQDDIFSQFGQPNKIDETSDHSTVDIFYSASRILDHVRYDQ